MSWYRFYFTDNSIIEKEFTKRSEAVLYAHRQGDRLKSWRLLSQEENDK